MKLPPIEKICEAWSAIADNRVRLTEDGATVTSSDGSKTYTIRHDAATDTYASDDNATYWRGYPGYPVIAVMMLRSRLPLDKDFAKRWAGINWTALNASYKRDYAAAVRHIETERNIDPAESRRRSEEVMAVLQTLPVKVGRLRSPK